MNQKNVVVFLAILLTLFNSVSLVRTEWNSPFHDSGAKNVVSVAVNGLDLDIGNSFFSASFRRGVATKVIVNGQNIINNLGGKSTFSVDYHNGRFNSFRPNSLKILEKTDDFAHVAYYQTPDDDISIEVHYIVSADVRGLYNYIVIENKTKNTKSVGEVRMVCRFDSTLMPSVHNGKRQVKTPLYKDLQNCRKMQDETWQLPDGTYYSKYDLAGYVRERNFVGALGGGKGAWFIHASHEYYSGGPLKQDLLVHQDALMIVYMSGSHFGTPALSMPPGFSKVYGPWLIYFNEGTDSELVKDVQAQAAKEKSAWPYKWVNDKRYDIIRGSVTGSVKGPKCAVILSPQDEVFDVQVRGYSYNTETNKDGSFSLQNVRPGAYTLTVYPVEGAAAGVVQQVNCSVSGGQNYNAGTLEIKEPSNIVWQIGQANRRSDGFVYSNVARNFRWQHEPPTNITFVIGKSDPTKHWYYAQTKLGWWNVEFQDTNDGHPRHILLSIAGASNFGRTSPKLHMFVNGKLLPTISYQNDQAIYREAPQSGSYHFNKIEVPAAHVQTGTNILSLNLVGGAFMYDTIVYLVAK